MRRIMTVVALGVGGLVLAVALSLGAFALAGHSLGRPATSVQVPAVAPSKGPPGDHGSPSRSPSPSLSLSQSPTVDHGDGGGHGSDD